MISFFPGFAAAAAFAATAFVAAVTVLAFLLETRRDESRFSSCVLCLFAEVGPPPSLNKSPAVASSASRFLSAASACAHTGWTQNNSQHKTIASNHKLRWTQNNNQHKTIASNHKLQSAFSPVGVSAVASPFFSSTACAHTRWTQNNSLPGSQNGLCTYTMDTKQQPAQHNSGEHKLQSAFPPVAAVMLGCDRLLPVPPAAWPPVPAAIGSDSDGLPPVPPADALRNAAKPLPASALSPPINAPTIFDDWLLRSAYTHTHRQTHNA